jgi:hypothetical protein
MAVTINGGGGSTLTFNVTAGTAGSNYASDFPTSFPAYSTLSSGGTESTVAGALNIIFSNGSPTTYALATGDQYTVVDSGDATTVDGSTVGGDTLLGGADMTYIEAAGAKDNRIVFVSGTNLFVGSSNDAGDTIVGGSGYDTIKTGGGPSTVFSGSGHTLAYLDDTVAGDIGIMQSGTTTIMADGVSDTVFASATGEIVGGTGNLFFVASASTAPLSISIVGGSGSTDMFGASNTDLTLSGGGMNVFVAGAGNETLNAAGSSGSVAFFGDTNSGDSVNTSVVGGSGSGYFLTGAGNEFFQAGTGFDSFNITSVTGDAQITIADFSPNDSVSFYAGSDSVGSTDNGNYTVTLSDGTKVEFLGITSLPGHTT